MGRTSNLVSASLFAKTCAEQCAELLSKDRVTGLLFEDFGAKLAAFQENLALDEPVKDKNNKVRAMTSDKCKGLVFEPAATRRGVEFNDRVCTKRNKKDADGNR